MKLFKDQRGIAHLVEIVIIGVLVLGGIGFIAWRVMSANQAGTGQSAELKKALESAKCDYSDKDLCKFFVSYRDLADTKVSSTQVAEGKTTSSTYESTDKGKKYHMIMQVEGSPYEVIGIDNTIYTKDQSDGKWWKQTIEPAKESDYKGDYNYNFQEPAATETPDKTSYKKIGTEACGNLTCFKYQIIDPNSTDIKQYMWFDNKDYQMRRYRTENNDGSSTDQTFSYAKVTINVPSPTKDLPANSYINPATGQAVTLPSVPTDLQLGQ